MKSQLTKAWIDKGNLVLLVDFGMELRMITFDKKETKTIREVLG